MRERIEKCPLCGSGSVPYGLAEWTCGSYEVNPTHQSVRCKLTVAEAEVERLKKEIETKTCSFVDDCPAEDHP